MHVDSIEIVDVNIKNYYFAFIFKMFIRMNFEKKYIALLNTKAEINVIIEKMMINENFFMKSRFHFNLMNHTKHFKIFLKICENITISIKKFIINHHIFVISEADHMLIFNQFFMKKIKTNIEWKNDDVYIIIHDVEIERQIIFRINFEYDHFSFRKKNEIFFTLKQFLN